MSSSFTLLVLHHSHTDIGYTEAQYRIERLHVDFLRQALAAVEARPAFRWVCETFWAVERFWTHADASERARLVRALRSGAIGLSASYLNFSELLDAPVLRAVTARAGRFGRAVGIPVRSAMTADVNGFGWGFAQALVDAGVENYFTCVHTHHGMYPLGRTQEPFLWETSSGDRVLVWSGEHYHYGNELGLVPGASSSYLVKDECDAATIFGDHRRVAETRIPRYVEALRARGYAYDFAPVMASGLRNDNAPPNLAVLDAIEWWNREHGGDVELRMATLDEFFERVRGSDVELPVHRGDWPDWWSDGPASRPRDVRLFRRAQRDLARVRALGRRYPEAAPGDVEAVETDLALFAEHTFSHSDSVAAPFLPLVHEIDAAKTAYASRASASAGAMRDAAHQCLGAATLRPALPLSWRVLNPHAEALQGVAGLEVGHYEFRELGLDRGFDVRDADSGASLPAELAYVPRGAELRVPLDLPAGAERRLDVVPIENGREAPESIEGEGRLETDAVRLAWGPGGGLSVFLDRRTGRDLLRRDAPHGAFQPVYDVTAVADPSEVCAVRGAMGLNRKGADARVDVGQALPPFLHSAGDVFDGATFAWDLDGTRFAEMSFRAHRYAPRVDAELRLHKESVWAPENLYAALPFTAGAGATLWIDKAGAVLRPRRDQVPGTLTDFYAVQTGFASIADDLGVVVLCPDHHLLQLGPLAHGERLLAGDPRLEADPEHVYAWLMTNYWETNFAADLGGFHAFRFSVLWGAEYGEPERAFARARAALLGPEVFRLGEPPA